MLPHKEQLLLRSTLRKFVATGKRIATNWSVITGAPGSGKSSLVNQLRSLGHQVVTDPAREILERRVITGMSKHEARSDYRKIQTQILSKMIVDARKIDVNQSVVFDYALPDNLAFLIEGGLPWESKYIRAACCYNYRRVFLLDILSANSNLDSDLVRTETREQRERIHELLKDVYRELEIPITAIPVGVVQDRVKWVLDSNEPHETSRSQNSQSPF